MSSSSGVLLIALSLILTAPTTRGRGKPLQISGAGGLEGDPGPYNVSYVSIFVGTTIICYFSNSPLQTRPNHSAIDNRFITKTFSRSALTGGPENIFPSGLKHTFVVSTS
jgi:hypothetical protein